MQLFEELILEGENTVLQDQFQEFHDLIFFQANGVASEGTTILVFSFWVLYVFSEQLLMMSKAVGTGMLVNKAQTSKETSSSSPLIFTILRWSLKLLLSLTKDGVIPVYLWRILVKNLASWYVDVPQAETMGRMGQLALSILGKP